MPLNGKANDVFIFVVVWHEFNLMKFTVLQYPGDAGGEIEITSRKVAGSNPDEVDFF
jgi:hypothetical protein